MSFSASVEKLVAESKNPLVASAQSWNRIPLIRVAKIINGYPLQSNHFSDREGVPVIRIRDVTAGYSQTFYKGDIPEGFWVFPGDIVIGMDGDFNSRIWKHVKALLNQRVCKIVPDESVLNKHFLAYLLPGYLQLINQETHSITVKHLSSKTIGEIPIPLPSIEEQHRIVARLDSLLAQSKAARAELHKAIALAKRQRQAVLTKAFSGELTQEWRERNVSHYTQDNSSFDIDSAPFRIPISWNWYKAEDICNLITKGTTPSKDDLYLGSGEIPYIKVYNLTFNGSLNFSIEPTFVTNTVHNGFLQRSRIFPGDVLMNIVGPPLGKVSIVPNTWPEWNMNQAIAVFRPKEMLNNQYIAYWLLSNIVLRWLTSRSKATAGQHNLTLLLCRNLPIPLPSLEEQQEIVKRIEAAFRQIETMENEAKRALALAERLEQATLAKAFQGQL